MANALIPNIPADPARLGAIGPMPLVDSAPLYNAFTVATDAVPNVPCAHDTRAIVDAIGTVVSCPPSGHHNRVAAMPSNSDILGDPSYAQTKIRTAGFDRRVLDLANFPKLTQ